jgi:hypothetical protein
MRRRLGRSIDGSKVIQIKLLLVDIVATAVVVVCRLSEDIIDVGRM